MSKVFVKAGELKIQGVYLVANDKPVFHAEFVAAQKRAEYVCTFAKLAKGRDFVGKKADSLEALVAEVNKELGNKATSYVKAPKEVKLTLNEQLKAEALDFMKYTEKKSNAEKVNNFLQEFNIINKFESVGLYFDEDVCELNRIYTIKEIVDAVESCIELL